MKKLLTRLTAVLLTAALLCACGASAAASAPATTSPVAAGGPTATPAPTAAPPASAAPEEAFPDALWPTKDGIHADVDYADMAWAPYDEAVFDEYLDALYAAKDADEAIKYYSLLMDEYKLIYTLDQVAWNMYYVNFGQDEDAERCQNADALATTASDQIQTAVAHVLSTPAGEGLAAFLGEDALYFPVHEEMPERLEELINRELELELAFDELLYRDDLSYKEQGNATGEIYLELLDVRNEIAAIYGYDSYAEYAYKLTYERDYTPEDAAALCESIHTFARKFLKECGSAFGMPGKEQDVFTDPEDLLQTLRTLSSRISPEAAEAERYMEEHGLYCLGYEDEQIDMGFVSTLEYYNAPFLYNCLYGNYNDLQDTLHEFGHFYNAYVSINPNLLIYAGSSDLFEVHSTGLEALSYFWLDELYGDLAEEGRMTCLCKLIDSVIVSCIMDEFQLYAYAHPDATVDELCEVYLSIRSSYGFEDSSERIRYNWARNLHIFEHPFYHISYAASALAALQLWTMAEQDFDRAMEAYNEIVKMGAFKTGYSEVLRKAGLALFFEDLDACLAEPLEALCELCRRYDAGKYDVKAA